MSRPQAQPSEKPASPGTVDPEEVARFSALAAEWWDPHGPFKPLHRMNPVRITYIRNTIAAHFPHSNLEFSPPLSPATAGAEQVRGQGEAKGEGAEPPVSAKREQKSPMSVLDIGTGGGLIAEPMARLGYQVTAIDASEKNIKTASLHAGQSGLTIDYRATTAEDLAASGAQFDVILALEIIEHVSNVDAFLDALNRLLTPGGLLILSTLNRTPKSYAFAILGAEYILRLLPRGTHQWRKFIRPSELARAIRARRLDVTDTTGMVMHPFSGDWSLSPRDLEVNYLLACTKPLK